MDKQSGSSEKEKYIDKPVREYLTDLAAKKPAPGGGSAAALLGAAASALVSMVCNYTLGKERFRSVEEQMQKLLSRSEELRLRFQEMVDLDIERYTLVSRVYKLPKGPERDSALYDALLGTLDVSANIARMSLDGVRLCPVLAEKANPNLSSDVGCAAWSFLAAFKCALINVDINLTALKDKEVVLKTEEEFTPLKEEMTKIVGKVIK